MIHVGSVILRLHRDAERDLGSRQDIELLFLNPNHMVNQKDSAMYLDPA